MHDENVTLLQDLNFEMDFFTPVCDLFGLLGRVESSLLVGACTTLHDISYGPFVGFCTPFHSTYRHRVRVLYRIVVLIHFFRHILRLQ